MPGNAAGNERATNLFLFELRRKMSLEGSVFPEGLVGVALGNRRGYVLFVNGFHWVTRVRTTGDGGV